MHKIDWDHVMQILSLITDSVKTLSIIFASFIALYGINSWRREMKGKKEFELAQEVLSLFYTCRDHFRSIRIPAFFKGEGKDKNRSNKESNDFKELPDEVQVIYERYERVSDDFIKLQSLKYKFMAIVGKEHEVLFNDITKVLNDILIAANQLVDSLNHEEKANYRKIIFKINSDNDPIDKKLDSIISKVEKVCKNLIDGYDNTFARKIKGWLKINRIREKKKRGSNN